MFPFRDDVPSRNVPVMTWVLIWANIIVFLYELSLGGHLNEFIRTFGLVPGTVTGAVEPGHAGIVIPFFTSMFLHGGWAHILGNMWFLYLFGDNVEDRLGPRRYLWFYIICGLVAAIVHVLFNAGSSMPTVGASGAVAGVLGAYLALYPQARVATLLWFGFFVDVVALPAVTFLGYWFIFQLALGLFSLPAGGGAGGVAWWAHVGGFAMGYLSVRLLCRECAVTRHPEDPRPGFR